MSTETKLETIRLESLPAAAACLTLCKNCELQEVELIAKGRCRFILRGLGLKQAVADFTLGLATGNLLEFLRHFDDLRTITRRDILTAKSNATARQGGK